MELTLLTWNINRAAHTRRKLWKYLEELYPDIAMLQEVYVIPSSFKRKYEVFRGEMNAILVKERTDKEFTEKKRLEIDMGNSMISDVYLMCEVTFSRKDIVIISVYNYMAISEKEFLNFWEGLFNYIKANQRKRFVIGGDFNMDLKFLNSHNSALRRWGGIMKRIVEGLAELGYKDVLSFHEGNEPFTFFSPNGKKPYQLDYLFLPEDITVLDSKTGDQNRIMGESPRLSDHLPIIAKIDI